MADHHLASLLVRVHPDRASAARSAIAALPGTEIHVERDGKLVVTVEGPDAGCIASRMTEMNLLPGVLSAVMVFHQVDTTPVEANLSAPKEGPWTGATS